MSREAIELCRPYGARHRFRFLPRADALPGSPTRAVFARWGGLGYLLNAPTGAESLGQRRYQSPRVQFSLDQEFCRGHEFIRAVPDKTGFSRRDSFLDQREAYRNSKAGLFFGS